MTFKDLGTLISEWFEKNYCIIANTIKLSTESTSCPINLALVDMHIVGGPVFTILFLIVIGGFIWMFFAIISVMTYALLNIIKLIIKILLKPLTLFKVDNNRIFLLIINYFSGFKTIYESLTWTVYREEIHKYSTNLDKEEHEHNLSGNIAQLVIGTFILIVFSVLLYLGITIN